MRFPVRGLQSLWRALGSTKLALILLLLLLLATIVASLFPQMPAGAAGNEAWLAAARLRYQGAIGLLHLLGLFQAFRAPWYLLLLGALMLNLAICTMQRSPRLWRALTRRPAADQPAGFYSGSAFRAEWAVSSRSEAVAHMERVLARRRYTVFTSEDEGVAASSLLAERGRWARVGSPLSHAAMFTLLLALLARPVLAWQRDGLILLPGEAQRVVPGGVYRVVAGQFTATRHPDGEIESYRVPLALYTGPLSELPGATPVMSETVELGQPLAFGGWTYHLRGAGPAIEVSSSDGVRRVALTGGLSQEVLLPQVGVSLRIAIQPDGESLFVEARTTDGAVIGSGQVPDGQEVEIAGQPVSFRLVHYTDWQVGRDPTFAVACAAGGLYLAAIVVSLWAPRRRLWARVDEERAQVVSTRQHGGADAEFSAIVRELGAAYSDTRPAVPPMAGTGGSGA